MSPIDSYDQQLFSLHMVEHLLLTLCAAPLLLLGRPLVPMLRALPAQERRGAARIFKPRGRIGQLGATMVRAPIALSLYLVVFATWHVPALYDAAQGSTLTHYAEHASLFGSALLFWWPVIHPHGGPRRLPRAAAVVYLILPIFAGTIIGALLTFSPRPIYATYSTAARVTNLSALDDQQLAGLIMWIPGGLAYLVPILALLARILRQDEAPPTRRLSLGQRL
jgi:cytochrome c oxidase assembly factor CtaG